MTFYQQGVDLALRALILSPGLRLVFVLDSCLRYQGLGLQGFQCILAG